MIVKALLIVAVVAIAAGLARGGARRLALRRVGLAVFALAAIGGVLYPDTLTWVAQRIGVGRGADLMLYVLIVAFLSYIATRFAHDRRTDRRLTDLARCVALAEAPPPRPDGR
ncbi:MAG: DUF2304 domain-containing protein [Bifidobacteriaceae bacterium]|jgi:hypothetical protein|nr:DUF2304 domain-containing protein [Bifidobacteriaceae bacterium]